MRGYVQGLFSSRYNYLLSLTESLRLVIIGTSETTMNGPAISGSCGSLKEEQHYKSISTCPGSFFIMGKYDVLRQYVVAF